MSRIIKGTKGSVYLLVSASAVDYEGVPLLKIGATTDDPHIRAKQISAATAAPTPFVVAYYRRVSDCTAVESALHDLFDGERVNSGREFFRVPLHRAILELDRLANGAADLGLKLSFAELFNSFPDDGTARELTPEEQAQCRALENSR